MCVSSASGVLPTIGRSAYVASKHAVNGFYNVLRSEMKPYGVGVTLACPGTFIGTDFRKNNVVRIGDQEDLNAPKKKKIG